MKLNEVLDPKEFSMRLQKTSGSRPDRINRLISLLKAKSQKNNPRAGDLRHKDEEEGLDPDITSVSFD